MMEDTGTHGRILNVSDCIPCCVLSHSAVSNSVTSWTVAHQAPLSMGFLRQEYWSGLPFSSTGDLPDPMSPAWQVDSLPLNHLGTPSLVLTGRRG